MKKTSILHQLLFVGLIGCLLLTSVSAAAGQNGNKYYISELDCAAFPTITMSLRGLDDSNNIISADLLANTFSIYENDTLVSENEIKPVGRKEGPKYVVFSFELGKTSNLEQFSANIKAALHTFANDSFNDNVDTVRIVAHTNNGTQDIKDILAPTKSLSVFESAIDNLNFSPSENDLDGYVGFEKLYTSLSKLNPGRYNMVIIDFNRLVLGFASPEEAVQRAKVLGKQFGAHGIRIYILNTYLPGWDYASPSLNYLASLSGGDILQFSDSSIRQAKLVQINNNIKNNSQVYRFQFRAHQYKDVMYSLAPKGSNLAAASDQLACPNAPALSLPVVEITEPKGANPVYYLKENEKTIAIKADLSAWPKDGTRQVALVELYDGNSKIDTKKIPVDSNATSFETALDVSNLVYAATYHLHVKVTDEFGIAGDSPEIVLTVNPYKPPTAVPTPAATPTATQTSIVTSTSCSPSIWNVNCITSILKEYLVWIILVIFLIIIIILFNTVRRLSNIAKPAREAISKGFDQVRKTLLGGSSVRQEAIAYLNVLVARPDRSGGKIEIYNNRTSLGRDPKLTDIQLYQLEEESTVSSLHCTIFYDQGKFFITDDNSSNGTFVNGKRLDANEPFALPDGAEIILGDVFRQGAKLRFEIASSTGAEQAVVAEEPDFHVDMPMDGAPSAPPPAPKAAVDDFRKTIPGYREDIAAGDQTQAFREPPATPQPPVAPQPAPVKKPAPGKTGKKGWMDDLS